MMMGGSMTNMGRVEYSQGVRQAIQRLHINETGFVLGGKFTLDDLRNSRFCLCPSGWGWGWRLSLAIATQCVPVIIQPNVTQVATDGIDQADKQLCSVVLGSVVLGSVQLGLLLAACTALAALASPWSDEPPIEPTVPLAALRGRAGGHTLRLLVLLHPPHQRGHPQPSKHPARGADGDALRAAGDAGESLPRLPVAADAGPSARIRIRSHADPAVQARKGARGTVRAQRAPPSSLPRAQRSAPVRGLARRCQHPLLTTTTTTTTTGRRGGGVGVVQGGSEVRRTRLCGCAPESEMRYETR